MRHLRVSTCCGKAEGLQKSYAHMTFTVVSLSWLRAPFLLWLIISLHIRSERLLTLSQSAQCGESLYSMPVTASVIPIVTWATLAECVAVI